MDDHLNSLYETDALIWTATQVALLRARKFDQLDLDTTDQILDMDFFPVPNEKAADP
jgi:hypothetical protein